jgi:hypothetical protein
MKKNKGIIRFDYEIPKVGILFCWGQSSFSEISDDMRKSGFNKSADETMEVIRESEDLITDKTDGFCWSVDPYGFVIFLKDNRMTTCNLATLVHETNHMVRFISNTMKFSDECEFTAYLQEAIFMDIFKTLRNVK